MSYTKIINSLLKLVGLNLSRTRPTYIKDKIRTVKIGKYDMLINGKSLLPIFLEGTPYYESMVPRLTKTVVGKYPDLTFLDIGSYIGDTVALILSEVTVPFVCIEGDDLFYDLLQENMKQFDKISTHKVFLGEEKTSVLGNMQSKQTTNFGSIRKLDSKIKGEGDQVLNMIPLDLFVEKNELAVTLKLVKIDTDGYDLKILRGGAKFLEDTKPVLFIEYDRVLIEEVGDNALSGLAFLAGLGYSTAIFYDNSGRMLLSGDIEDRRLMQQLDSYIKNRNAAFSYFDIALFHKDDEDIAQRFITSEMKFYNDNNH